MTTTDETPTEEPPVEPTAPLDVGDAAGHPELADETLVGAIRERAFKISLGPDSGTQEEDWLRAKQEILAELAAVDAARQAELEAARDEESKALLSAEIQAFGHP